MIRPAYDPYVALDGSTPAGGRCSSIWTSATRRRRRTGEVREAVVSSDRGKHWTQAPAGADRGRLQTVVAPWMLLPGKSLSVRTSVTDRSGNSVDQTVLDLVPVR